MNIQLSSIETLPKTLILEPEAAIHTQAVNDAQLACSYVASLRKDVEHLEDQVTYLLNLGPRASRPGCNGSSSRTASRARCLNTSMTVGSVLPASPVRQTGRVTTPVPPLRGSATRYETSPRLRRGLAAAPGADQTAGSRVEGARTTAPPRP